MKKHLDDLKEIRLMMEKSSKFLSLSGSSGIAAGTVALLASFLAYWKKVEITDTLLPSGLSISRLIDPGYVNYLTILAVITLLSAISLGFYFTWRKTKNKPGSLWNPITKKLLVSMGIPLVAGGFLIIALLMNRVYWVIPEISLLFYGLALINASQYTYRDVYFLGLCEVGLGILALFVNGYSLLFWAFGFGVLHIAYGISMYFKYERIETSK